MGFFDWLRGKKDTVHVALDRIWLTREAKFNAIQEEIVAALADQNGPNAIFLVGHFEDCLDELRSLAAHAGFDANRVLVIGSDALRVQTAERGLDQSRRVLIVVGERHLLSSRDDALLQFARSLACRCRFVQHVSLEDPVLKLFAGPWVERVLRGMGMKENEAIESRMVGRRVRLAQQKIERLAIGDSPARSAQEWMEKNCPNYK